MIKRAVVRAYHNPDIAHKNIVKVRKGAPGSHPERSSGTLKIVTGFSNDAIKRDSLLRNGGTVSNDMKRLLKD